MIAQYTPKKQTVTEYGIDFFDADGNEVGDIAVGESEAERDALYDEIVADDNHPRWPETAVRIRQWSRQVEKTTFSRSVHTPHGTRNPLTGRWMRSSYRENLGY